MKTYLKTGALLSILFISCTESPKQNWYKGNLHTHTYWSDGDEFPEMVLDWYQSHGYDFIGLSDHNTMAKDEKWIVIQKSPLYEEGFQNYLNKFSKDWVVSKNDTGRIQVKLKTFTEYQTKMQRDNFLIIPSEEITSRVGKKPVHINATNLQEFVPPVEDSTVALVMQRTVDAVLEQRKQIGKPMFPHINHPNFGWAISVDDFINLKGERFFEVYNGHNLVNNYGDSTHMSTEAMWDLINIAYAKRGQDLIYGLATDDSHNYHQFGSSFSNAGRGFVMVQSNELTPDSIIKSMEAGNFYASTGVYLKTLKIENNKLEIEVKAEEGIAYTIEFIGARSNEDESGVLQTIKWPKATFTIPSEYLFVRARITSTKKKENPFKEGDFEMAWTQPVQYTK